MEAPELAPALATEGFDWASGPRVLYLGDPPTKVAVTLYPPPGVLCGCRSFIGWDAGSRGEAGMDVAIDGVWVYERSDHKEAPTNYDAWQESPYMRRQIRPGDPLDILAVASQTAPNATDQGRSTRVEFALRLSYCAS